MFVVKRLFDIEKPTPPLGFFESWPPPSSLQSFTKMHNRWWRFLHVLGMIQLSSGFPLLYSSFILMLLHKTWPIVLHFAAKVFKNLFLQSCSWWGCIKFIFFKTYFRNRSDAIALKAICLFHRSFQNWINKTEVVNPFLSTMPCMYVQNAQN